MSLFGDLTPADMELLLDAVESSTHSSDVDETAHPLGGSESSQSTERPSRATDYRRRQRDELARLRREVEALQLRLENLERTAVRCAATTQSTSLAWKRMATQQLKSLRRAERENADLKRSLEQQLKLAHQLKRILGKHANRQDTDLFVNHTSESFQLMSRVEFPFPAFSDTSWDQVDAAFAEMGFANLPSKFHGIDAVHLGHEASRFVQARYVRVFPFDWTTTTTLRGVRIK